MTANRLLYTTAMTLSLAMACGDDTPEPLRDDKPAEDAGAEDAGSEDAGDAPELLDCDVSNTLAAGDVTMTLSHGGVDRSFVLHVPASYDGKKLVPLVLDIHGLNGSAEYQKLTSGWLEKSDEQGFLVAYPSGLASSWNGGAYCCGQSRTDKVDDEGFMRALVEKLKGETCVNPKRVYATGLSNGGAMAHLLACHAADMFAAVAPISMGSGALPCEPSRGISVTMFRATGDELVPYETSEKTPIPSAQADLDQWKTTNQCKGSPDTTRSPCQTYSECKDGSDVTLCTITTTAADTPWGGHLLYTQAAREGVKVPDFVWPVFERHRL
jgi:polyhydroxybutyrate depolymerase